MTAEPVKVGIVGLGRWAKVLTRAAQKSDKLEIVSATGFIVSGLRKGDARSNEGAIKFLLIGVLSTAVMLFGMSIVYGLTQSIRLDEIAAALADANSGLATEPAMIMAMFLVITGFAFKVSAAPFHFWAPDTYEGSPVPVAGFQFGAYHVAMSGLSFLSTAISARRIHCWRPSSLSFSFFSSTCWSAMEIAT